MYMYVFRGDLGFTRARLLCFGMPRDLMAKNARNAVSVASSVGNSSFSQWHD